MRPYIIRNVLVCEEDMIINNEKIAKALEYIKSEDENTTQETLTMCQIPAPSHQEKKKAEYVLEKFKEIGLLNVHMTDDLILHNR